MSFLNKKFIFLLKNIIFPLFWTVFGFYLYSCNTISAKTAVETNLTEPFIWLTNTAKFILLPPSYIEKTLDEYQLMTAAFRDTSYMMNTWVKADSAGLDITLLNEMGANMGELIWRDGKLTFTSSMFPPQIRAEYIVADFQFCFYKAQALRDRLEKINLSLTETENTRLIHRGNTRILEITKEPKKIKLTNYLRGYIYTLEGEFK